MNILEKIISYKRREMAARKLIVPEKVLLLSPLFSRKCISMDHWLRDKTKTGIIAEFKRKSPSKGFINSNADVKKITHAYTSLGASGLSVLTDNHFFGGSLDDFSMARENEIPILRKDFLLDEYDILQSKAIGADVILLIAACLSVSKVKSLSAFAKTLGLEVLLEIHSEKEILHICDEVDLVGVNNRDLKTFEVNINRSIRLSKLIPEHKIKIAESGIDDVEMIHIFKAEGFIGFLIGEKFMKETDPGEAFKQFTSRLKTTN